MLRAQGQGQEARTQDQTPTGAVAQTEQENSNANKAIEEQVARECEQTGTGDKEVEKSWSSDSDVNRIVETGSESIIRTPSECSSNWLINFVLCETK